MRKTPAFFLRVRIKLWAYSLPRLTVESNSASKCAKDLKCFKNRQHAKKKQTKPNKNPKAKSHYTVPSRFSGAEKTLRSTPLKSHMYSSMMLPGCLCLSGVSDGNLVCCFVVLTCGTQVF